MNKKQLLALRKRLIARRKAAEGQVNAMLSASETENRDLSTEEQTKFDDLVAERDKLNARIETIDGQLADLGTEPADDEPADDEPIDDEGDDDEGDDEPTAPTRSRRPAPTPPSNRGRSQPLTRATPGNAPAAHTRERRWSFLGALRQSYEMKTRGRRFDGIEAEIHQELLKRRASSEPPQGILIPLGNEPEFRELLYGRKERRDLSTTTAQGAVFTAAELPFIELLRKKMVLQQLGATFLTGLQGAIAIPRQSGSATAYWVAEGVPITVSNQTLDQVALTPKTLGAGTIISRKLMYQSSVDADGLVRNDLAKVCALELDRAGINGSGSGAEPRGILQTSAIATASSSLQGGTNGAAITFARAVAMESLVAASNADVGSLKYLTTPGLRGALKTTVKATGQPVYIYEDDEINGYPVVISNQVPSNLTKGTSSGVCHAIVFGNWADLLIGQWGGIDTVVNPYTNQLSGSVTISMMLEADVAVRHNESFAAITDALAA